MESFPIGQWNLVYQWPPPKDKSIESEIELGKPDTLEHILNECRCNGIVNHCFGLIKFTGHSGKYLVHAYEIVKSENDVIPALSRPLCSRSSLEYKIVILPLNENAIVLYEKAPNADYDGLPFMAKLLHKKNPTVQEIMEIVKTMDLKVLPGGLVPQVPRNR